MGAAPRIGFRQLVGPLVFSATAPTLANAAVMAVIGHFGSDELYLRSAYGPVAFLVVAVVTGTAVSLQTWTAQRADVTRAHLAPGLVRSALMTALGVYAVLALVLCLAAPVAAALLGVPDHLRGAFTAFLVPTVLASALVATGEALAGILRGAGAAGAGAVITAVSALTNVTVVLMCVHVGGLGLDAVPVGLAAAGGTATVLALVLCSRAGLLRRGDRAAVRAALATMRRTLLRVGAPVTSSYVLLFVVNLAYLHVVGASDVARVAGFTIGYTIQTLAILPGIGIGGALAITVNRLDAVGRDTDAARVLDRVLVRSGAGYLGLGAAVVALHRPLTALYTTDPVVAAEAHHYLAVAGASFGVLGFLLVLVTVLEQVGRGFAGLTFTLGYFVVVVVVGGVTTAATGDTTALYVTMLVTTVLAGAVGVPVARRLLAARPGRPLPGARPQEDA